MTNKETIRGIIISITVVFILALSNSDTRFSFLQNVGYYPRNFVGLVENRGSESETNVNPYIREMAYIPAFVPYITARDPKGTIYKVYCFPPDPIPNVGQSVSITFTKPLSGQDPIPQLYRSNP